MSVVAIADIVAVLACCVAVFNAVRIDVHARAVGRGVKDMIITIGLLLLFISVSNTLEHTGLTGSLDTYEDYAELLFVPLVLGAVYTRVHYQRLDSTRRAEKAIRSEHELLESIVATTPAGIIVADDDGTVRFANDVGERMLAQVRDGQLDLAAIVRSGESAYPRVSIGSDEDPRYVSVRATALTTGPDEPARAVVVLADVTDRVRNEDRVEEYRQGLERAIDLRTGELLEANRQLQYASNAKQQFLAKMSHELRTPLNSIIGFTEIILKGLSGPLTEEQSRQLGMVRVSGQHLLELVNDVLEISRLEAGYSPVSIATVDVCARMAALVESMSGIATISRIALVYTCVGSPVAETDPDKLDQIVRNLVSNALKFTDAGGQVTVSVTSDTDCAVIAVADTGIGIAEEDHERIFEAFQQVEMPDRARPPGTGLGLVICKELCGALGCVLTIESTPNRGSVFTVTVPRQFPGHLVIL